MLQGLRSVAVLLVAIFILMAGGGSLSTLISVQLQGAGVAAPLIGAVATAYFGGLTLGSLFVYRLIARVGHIRAFTAFVSFFSASALTYSLHVGWVSWAAVRLLEGFCIAGVYVCLESWLNDKAPAGARGQVLAFYMVALYAGQAAGQFLLNLGESDRAFPFIAASMLLSVAVIPIALTRQAPPDPPTMTALDLKGLYRASPLGVAGAVSNGLMMGAFYGLGAVFASAIGLSTAQTAVFMSAAILGGVALQWPLGRLSDLIDRRLVIIGVLTAIAAAAGAMALSAAWPDSVRLVTIALFGGGCFALYPLCVAHTNDQLAPEDRVAASGGLVLSYSAGAMAGPIAASALMSVMGARGVFVAIAAVAGAALGFALLRTALRRATPNADQGPFVAMPRTTPAAAVMDPLAADSQT